MGRKDTLKKKTAPEAPKLCVDMPDLFGGTYPAAPTPPSRGAIRPSGVGGSVPRARMLLNVMLEWFENETHAGGKISVALAIKFLQHFAGSRLDVPEIRYIEKAVRECMLTKALSRDRTLAGRRRLADLYAASGKEIARANKSLSTQGGQPGPEAVAREANPN